MAFIVEDGTGHPDSNAGVSVEFADQYFTDRGITAWPSGPAEIEKKQGWIIQATDYVEARFGRAFIGYPTFPGQGLHFPATCAGRYTRTEMPLPYKKALCEYAIRAKNAPLAPDPTVDAAGFSVVTTKKKVGPIEKEFRVMAADSSSAMIFRPYPAADSLIASLLRPGQNRVIR